MSLTKEYCEPQILTLVYTGNNPIGPLLVGVGVGVGVEVGVVVGVVVGAGVGVTGTSQVLQSI